MTYQLTQDDTGSPVLSTARLHLRKPTMDDIPACYHFWSSDRSHMMFGPWTPETQDTETRGLLDQWEKHSFSRFTAARHRSDEGIGPFFPDSHPEPELGWSLWSAADEGQGLAHGAAAARDWFFATSGYRTAISFTDPQNRRSHRLCERLGGVVDPTAPVQDKGDVVYRYHAGIPA